MQGLEYDSDDSVYLRFPSPRRTKYEVLSEAPGRTRIIEAGSQEHRAPDQIGVRYLQLPLGIDPRIARLAEEITRQGKSTIEKATLVEDYLKSKYRYTLNLTWKPGPQPVSTFLFDAKAGHCGYFASAMAILLRSAGIPTRLINGF
jgi:transglutaminase-like putative cysteine protease